MAGFHELVSVQEVLGLSCSGDAELIAINELDGRVRLLACSPASEPEWLPLEFDHGELRSLLLLPEGRVCALVGEAHPRLHVHDVRDHEPPRVIDPGLELEASESFDEDDDVHDDDDASGDEQREAIRRLHASVLEQPATVCMLLSLELLHNRRTDVTTLPSEQRRRVDELLWPDRFARLARHPNGCWLGVLDRACFVIDLDSGELISTVDRSIDERELFAYGEGSHTLAFDQRGQLCVATTAISGNPYLSVERFETATGEHVTTSENWQHTWYGVHELHTYDPTVHLPPSLIPADEHLVVYRRVGLELWSDAGLQRTLPLSPNTAVIPSFDLGCFVAEGGDARVLCIDDEQLTLIDLLSGQRTPCRPTTAAGAPVRADALRWVEFVPERRELLLWTDDELLATCDGARWTRLALPEGRRPLRWIVTGYGEALRVVLLDEAGTLWRGELSCEASPPEAAPTSLPALEADALARPDTPECFAVLADALIERGDVRGELIALQLRGADDEADALLQRHAARLLPGLERLPDERVSLVWKYGHVREASFRVTDREELADVLCFLGSELARLLEELEIAIEPPEGMLPGYADELRERLAKYLAAAARWPRLREPVLR